MEEIWKNVNVSGYENYYQVSNLGRLRSLPKMIYYSTYSKYSTGQIVKSKLYSNYLQVCLCVNQKRKHIHVHRLVALTFIPNPLNKPCINHKNGNKLCNYTDNLEWCTYSENSRHLFDVLGAKGVNLGKKGIKAVCNKKVNQYSKEGVFIKTYYSLLNASEQTNINATSICKALKHKINTAGGFLWKYYEETLMTSADKVFEVSIKKGVSKIKEA